MERVEMVDNLLEIYRQASKETRTDGKNWYRVAHSIAKSMASRYMLRSTSHAAGVISALSPAVKWETNVKDAERVCAARPGELVSVSTYGQFLAKALSIRDGDNPKKWIKQDTAPKTYAFWRCLTNPFNTEHVTIDRHALAACLGRNLTDKERGGMLKKVGAYAHYSQAYKDAAKEVGILPLQLQAICWVQWRDNHA